MRTTASTVALLCAFVVALAGCYETVSIYTLNPDGSGKVTFDCKARVPNISLGKEPTPEEHAKKWAAGVLEGVQGVAAWKDITVEPLDDGRVHMTGTAYFHDIKAFQVKEASLQGFAWSVEGDRGTLAVQNDADTEGAEKRPEKMTDEELQKAMKEKRKEYAQSRVLIAGMMQEFKAMVVIRLPGKVIDAAGFARAPEQNEVSLSFEGTKLLEAMDTLIADDDYLREVIRSDRSQMAGGSGFDARTRKLLFGDERPAQATVTDMKPQFDFGAEVAAAKEGFAAMIAALDLGEDVVVKPPPDRGQGFTSLTVGGVRLVRDSDSDNRIQPFRETNGLTLSLIGTFAGTVQSVEEVRIFKTTADTGQDLTPVLSMLRSIKSVRTGDDDRTVVFEVELAEPNADVAGIRELTGAVRYRLPPKIEEVDLGIGQLRPGTEGRAYSVAVTGINKKSADGKAIEVTLEFEKPPESYLTVSVFRADDPARAMTDDGIENWGLVDSQSIMELDGKRIITLSCAPPLPEKVRTVAVLRVEQPVVEAPFSLNDLDLLGRPIDKTRPSP